jgi:hypothetical protein
MRPEYRRCKIHVHRQYIHTYIHTYIRCVPSQKPSQNAVNKRFCAAIVYSALHVDMLYEPHRK